MTDTNQKFRALVLTALMVLSVFAGTVALSGSAVATNPTRDDFAGGTSAPVVVFLGEENLNVSNVSWTDPNESNTSNTDITIIGVAGDADGQTTTINTSLADFTENNGITTGGYDVSGGDTTLDISVRRAEVTDETLYLGADDSGADITGEGVPGSTPNVTVEGEFNFGTASYLEVEVTDEAGLDVTNQVRGSRQAVINSSSGDFRMDVSGLDDGTYTVEVGAPVSSGLQYATSTATFTLGGSGDASISLDKTEVTQGERVIATVTGTPGENVTVRLDSSDLANTTDLGTQADNLFGDTADVLNRTNDSDQVAAVVELGDDGEGQVRLLTQHLDDSNTATLEVVSNATSDIPDFDTESEDDIDLVVNSRDISVSSSARNVVVGEEFDLSGTAAEAENVYAYVLLNDVWEPLTDDDNNVPAQDVSVLSDGSYSITIDSSQNISIPGSYQVGVITGSSVPDDANANNGDGLSRSYFSGEVSAKTSISTQAGSLSASLSEDRLAVGDTLTVSGTAVGQGSTVRVYVIGPRGAVGLDNATVVAATDEFETDFDSDFSNSLGTSGGATFDRTGTHTVLVVGAGRNGNFASGAQAQVASGNLASEQVALIEDAYTGAGVDDTIQQLTFVSENAQIDIDPVGTNGQITPGVVTVSGTSNRESPGGADVFVDVLDSDGNVLTSETATVDGASNTWSVDVDLSDVSTGQDVRIVADDGDVTDSVSVSVVSSISTPTETTTQPPQTVTVTRTVTQTVTVTQEPQTVTVTVTPEDTDSGGQPGFGIAIAIVALLGAGLLALRRRD